MTCRADRRSFAVYNVRQPGDPLKGAKVVDVLHGESVAVGKPFATSLVLGSDAYELIKDKLSIEVEKLELAKGASCGTDFE